jgi:hypothetical protein
MRRRLIAVPIAMATTLLLVATALAGGWASATLDPGAAGPQAGTPTTLGFRVLQHGQTPNSSLTVVVHAASSASGGAVSAAATAQGAAGHYVATLTFPTEGAWTITWTSELDMSASSAPLTVGAAVPAAPVAGPAPTPAPTRAPVDSVGVLVVGLVLVAIVGGVIAMRRRRAPSAPSLGS